MSGQFHNGNRWPPGRLHDDLQGGKKEVFRYGEWSIYDATDIVTNGNWNSFIMHCRSWKEWEPVMRPPVSTWIKHESTEPTSTNYHYKIEVTKRCNANMTAETFSRCPDCRAVIPAPVVALWKLQNFDKIQEVNSV